MTALTSPQLAHSLLSVLARAGVREWCVCAGARNAPLVAVMAKTLGFRLWSFSEERSAAFFALGRAARLGQPVGVVTTSGTAAAELLPAAIESYYQGVSLVLLTADRPRHFRGSGAPQSIEQVGLFSAYAPVSADIDAADFDAEALMAKMSRGLRLQRPIHINVCLEEPDATSLAAAEPVRLSHQPLPRHSTTPDPLSPEVLAALHLGKGGGLLILAGALKSAQSTSLIPWLQALGAPVWAEATSGLREVPALQAQAVGSEAALAHLLSTSAISAVVRLGGVPSCRLWRDLESRPEIAVISAGDYRGLGRSLNTHAVTLESLLSFDPSPSTPPATPTATPLQPTDLPQAPHAMIRALSELIPAGAHIYLGNSLPIRQWNESATSADRQLQVTASRGANGIDGQLSTFLGLSANFPGNDLRIRGTEWNPLWLPEHWAILGDLTTLYDLSAPMVIPQLPAARRRIVVLNNGGGKIFRQLPALRHAFDPSAWRLMENPHEADFSAWAALWKCGYAKVTDRASLSQAIDRPEDTLIIEITEPPVS